MTDDAYLVLFDDGHPALGVPLAAAGEPACLDTAAVRAWLGAQGVSLASPRLRVVPPEDTPAIPKDAERLPVPLSDEELNRVRHQSAHPALAGIERELLAYRSCADGREALLRRALAAGLPARRIAEITGEDLAAVHAAAG